MKIKILVVTLMGLITTATAFAQKGELSNAQENYDKYQKFKAAGPALSLPSLTVAKTSIDKASTNEKTANLPQTYALKGAIYASLALKDTVAATSAPMFATAEEAIKKAKELDTKGEYKNMLTEASTDLAQYKLSEGVKAYKAQKFDLAYTSFDKYRQIMPDDTNAIYFTALSANNSKNYPAAVINYNKLLTTKYSQNALIYIDLSNVYMTTKDTASAIKATTEGIAKYPSNGELRKRQIELYLKSGKKQEVLDLIQSAITNDPKNKTLYYYGGFTYTQLADLAEMAQKKTKDAAEKDKLGQSKLDNYAKAAELYKKALELDPNFYEANLNMGYVLMKPGIETYNAAQQLPGNKQKEYDAAVAKAGAQLDAAKPYLLKAVELEPKSIDALSNLKTYYAGKRDMTNVNEISKKIEALKQ